MKWFKEIKERLFPSSQILNDDERGTVVITPICEAQTLGTYLKSCRKLNNYSLREVSDHTSIASATISRIEKDYETYFWNVIRLINFYGIPLDAINKFLPKDKKNDIQN